MADKEKNELEVEDTPVELSDEELGEVAGGTLRRVKYTETEDIQDSTRDRV